LEPELRDRHKQLIIEAVLRALEPRPEGAG
jgi:hypothetical protein